MSVKAERSWGGVLSCSGGRGCRTRNATPRRGSTARKKRSKASSPPADAPSATMRQRSCAGGTSNPASGATSVVMSSLAADGSPMRPSRYDPLELCPGRACSKSPNGQAMPFLLLPRPVAGLSECLQSGRAWVTLPGTRLPLPLRVGLWQHRPERELVAARRPSAAWRRRGRGGGGGGGSKGRAVRSACAREREGAQPGLAGRARVFPDQSRAAREARAARPPAPASVPRRAISRVARLTALAATAASLLHGGAFASPTPTLP